MENFGNNILIVDDEKNTREGLQRFLEQKGHEAHVAQDAEEALQLAKELRPDIILLDLRMPGMDGMQLLQRLKTAYPKMVIIMLTAYGTVETAVQAMKAGAYYYLTKPVNLDELELILRKAAREQSLEHENQNLRQDLIREKFEEGKIVGDSLAIKKLIDMAKQIAGSSATVLIEGESGTGKELFAHMIHDNSPRKNKPFVTVHCAALTETLLASELFGHERGAFTGATERKIGRFERADGGTLFLDEIGEISEETQVKLLRFLQEGEFERVGSSKTMKVDVRLICATNKNLKNEVAAGRFREDLFYRINVILLTIPPLRERREDITLLANYYLRYFSRQNQKKISKIEPETLKKLENYTWPGNIRELRNIIERAVVLAKSDTIGPQNIPDDLEGTGIVRKMERQTNSLNSNDDFKLSALEKSAIERALKNVNGNKSLAAKELGISRRTLYRKLDEYKLSDTK